MRTSTRAALRRLSTSSAAVVAALGVVAGTAFAAFADTGVDVASYQHPSSTPINWSAAKADGVSFAFVKATEGTGYTNPYLAQDWAGTRSVGIFRGAYHFARPSIGSAAAQARYFVNAAGHATARGELPPVLDLEVTGGLGVQALQTWTATWLKTVQSLTGRVPMIYVSPYFWETSMGDSTAFSKYPLWIANYGVSSPTVPGGWTRWTFWQSTSTARVDGISGSVDYNRFNGTRRALKRLANITTTTTGDSSTPTGTTAPTPPTPTDPTTGTSTGSTTTPTDPTSGTTTREPVVRAATTLTLAADQAAVYAGRSVTLSGTLTTATGSALPTRTVRVFSRPQDGSAPWTQIATLSTDTAGSYSLSVPVSAAATFKARWRGGRRYLADASEPQAVSIRPQTTVRVDANAEHRVVRRGQAAKLYGHLTTARGALVSRRVNVYQHVAGTSGWSYVGRVKSLAPTGWWQMYVKPRKDTTYRSAFGGTVRLTSATSRRVAVSVR